VNGHRLIGAATAAAGLAAVVLAGHPPALPWQSQLDFALAAPAFGELDQDAAVYLDGVQVGQVQGLELLHGQARIQVAVQGGYAHLLHADASATIRPHGLLGPEYVDLHGGSRGRLLPGTLIPASRVTVAVGIDQVLDALQPDVRQSLEVLIDELGQGTQGRGQDLNQTLLALGQASGDLASVTATVHQHDPDLQGIIGSAQQLSDSLQYSPLADQLRSTDQVLSGLAQPQTDGALGSGLDQTAAVLAALNEILSGNQQNLATVLGQAPALMLRLRTLLAEGDTVVQGVNPALPSLMTAVVETQSAFSGHDANGNYVRVLAVPGACTAGLNLGCAVGPSLGSPTPAPSDQNLTRMLLGNG
jgi:virulence factor Mce-like protein